MTINYVACIKDFSNIKSKMYGYEETVMAMAHNRTAYNR